MTLAGPGGGRLSDLRQGPDPNQGSPGGLSSKELKEAGGDTTRLLEVDILRNQSHDMSKDDAMYAALLRIAMLGWIDAVIGGSNCRTRSELRHHPVTGLPGPSRSLGKPWSLDELDEWRGQSAIWTMCCCCVW